MTPFERDKTSIRYRVLDHITMYPGKTARYLVTPYGAESIKIKVASDQQRIEDRMPDILAECDRRGIKPEAWCKIPIVSASGVVAPLKTVWLGDGEPTANQWGHNL